LVVAVKETHHFFLRPCLMPSLLLAVPTTLSFIFSKKNENILIGRIRMTFDIERTPGRLANWLKQRPDEHDVKEIFYLLPDHHHQTAFIIAKKIKIIGSLRFS
jgi:hypothetical protein